MPKTEPNINKTRIVLNALQDGIDVEMGSHIYRMRDDYLMVVMTRKCEGKPDEEVELGADMSLSHFIKETKKMSYDDVMILSANAVLTVEKNNKARRRRQRHEN
jgi:hypothetical protein